MYTKPIIFISLNYLSLLTYFSLLSTTLHGRQLKQVDFQSNLIDPECVDEVNLIPEAAKIAGGYNVGDSNRWPYMVALQLPFPNDSGFIHHCAGVLIAPTLVLTGAQCVWIQGGVDFRFEQRFAEGPLTSGLTAAIQPLCRHQMGIIRIPVVRYYMYPEYTGSPITSGNHDIAVLVLEQEAPTSAPFMNYRGVQDVDLDLVSLAVSLGWGGTDVSEQEDPQLFARSVKPLQIAGLSLFKSLRCQNTIEKESSVEVDIDGKQVLCGFNQNVQLCFGDSGGPLILADGAALLQVGAGHPRNDILLGLVSWGPDFSCSSNGNFPTVFANIKAYVSWIDSIVETEALQQRVAVMENEQGVLAAVTSQSGPVAVIVQNTAAPTLSMDECQRPESLMCDRDALLQFRVSRPLIPQFLLSWEGQNPCEGWYGVSCSQVQSGAWRVVQVNLGGAKDSIMGGQIPSEISNLRYLQELDLAEQDLTGTIPPETSFLSNLRRLRMSFNSLTGTLPVQFSSLQDLEYIALPKNQLIGTIPVQYSELTNLEFFSLTGNAISGSLPTEFSELTAIKEMLLGGNQLWGEIPLEWSELMSLQKLWIDENIGICGGRPGWLGNMLARSIVNLGKQVVTTGTKLGDPC